MATHDTRVELPHLREWRAYRLLTVRELAHASGVAYPTINVLENGKRAANLTTVGKLAAALGVTRRQLVDDAPPSSDSHEGESERRSAVW
jgi:DNA-binding XRE family transcriptional regulator